MTVLLEEAGIQPDVLPSIRIVNPTSAILYDDDDDDSMQAAMRIIGGSSGSGGGVVLVDLRMNNFWPQAEVQGVPAAEVERLKVRAIEAAERMARLAVLLLSCGRLAGVGGPGAVVARSPRLMVVSMMGSMSQVLQICRHRVVSKLLLRAGKVRAKRGTYTLICEKDWKRLEWERSWVGRH